jgi:hypothetical protein
MNNDPTKIVPQEVLPPESRELRMPDGTPLGLGFLGAARFSAIRRVLDYATRAAEAKANYHAAEGAVAISLIHREVAREQLRNLDTIRQDAADKITEGAYLAKLERKLRTMELEDQIVEREDARAKAKTTKQGQERPAPDTRASDKFADILADLKRIPELAKTGAAVKAQIIADAGGEDKLDEGQRTMIETIDAILAAVVQKQAEDNIL